MKTIAQLRAELDKFPDEALCIAYSGEVNGITVQRTEESISMCDSGFIHLGSDAPTELLESKP